MPLVSLVVVHVLMGAAAVVVAVAFVTLLTESTAAGRLAFGTQAT